MKNALLALALFAAAGTAAFAHEGPGKTAKGKKAACSMAGGTCCMKGMKTAAAKPAPKAAVAKTM